MFEGVLNFTSCTLFFWFLYKWTNRLIFRFYKKKLFKILFSLNKLIRILNFIVHILSNIFTISLSLFNCLVFCLPKICKCVQYSQYYCYVYFETSREAIRCYIVEAIGNYDSGVSVEHYLGVYCE